MNEILENKKLKEFPFGVPDGYFASLEERVRDKMKVETEAPNVAVWRTLRASLALAAAFILIVALGGVILKYTTGAFQNNSETLAQQTQDEIVADSIQTLFLAEQIYQAVAEGEDVEEAYSQALETINANLAESDDYNELVTEYLNSVPSAYSNLLAEEFSK